MLNLLFAATWLVHRPVGVCMCDMLNSELDNQPVEHLSRAMSIASLNPTQELPILSLEFSLSIHSHRMIQDCCYLCKISH